jgi:hypothetical protein
MCLSIVLRMRLCRRVPAVRHISTEMETLATHVQSAPRAYEPRIHSASRLKRPWSRTLHQFGPHTVLTLLRPAIASQQGHSSPVQMQCGVNRSALLHSKRGICQGPSSPLSGCLLRHGVSRGPRCMLTRSDIARQADSKHRLCCESRFWTRQFQSAFPNSEFAAHHYPLPIQRGICPHAQHVSP